MEKMIEVRRLIDVVFAFIKPIYCEASGLLPCRLLHFVIPDLQAMSQSKFERKIRLGHAGLDPASSKKVNNFNWILNRPVLNLIGDSE
jgi:hypothetical protein